MVKTLFRSPASFSSVKTYMLLNLLHYRLIQRRTLGKNPSFCGFLT
jgi:hypothetical protein